MGPTLRVQYDVHFCPLNHPLPPHEQGDCTRVSGFWKPGAWMPLLAALRRLENGAVCPGLDDLKKSSTSMAAHLSR